MDQAARSRRTPQTLAAIVTVIAIISTAARAATGDVSPVAITITALSIVLTATAIRNSRQGGTR